MHRGIGLALLLTTAGAGGADAGRPAATDALPDASRGARALDARAAYYREDADGRRVARIEATLLDDGTAVRLRLSVSALDPLVEPPPGDRGLVGSNEVTARELTSVLAEGRLTVRVRDAQGRETVVPARAAETGRLRRRVIEPVGRVRFVPASVVDHVLAMDAETAPLPRGTSVIEVVVDGRVVVRATAFVSSGGSRLRSLDCLGEHGPAESSR
jgi:hypothetical protein